MKALLISLFVFIGIHLHSQYALDIHTIKYEYYLTVKMDAPNSLLWFYTSKDSVLIDNKTLVYKSSPLKEYSAFFVILNPEGQVQRYNEIYTKDTLKGSALLAYMDISDFNDGYYVSFFYYGNDLWCNDQVLFQDETAGKYIALLRLSKSGEVISCWRYPVSKNLLEVWVRPFDDGKLVLGGTASWDPVQLGAFYLPCTGCHVHDSDVFVAIIDSTGTVLNAKRFGSDVWDYGRAIATTQGGNIYMAGSYCGSPFRADSFTLTNHGFTQLTCDAFLMKLNENLEIQWLQRAWGTGLETSQGLEQDPSGNLYWALNCSSPQVNIGDTTFAGNKVTGLLAKISPDGELRWIQHVACDKALNIRNISADADGNIWANVNFNGNLLTPYQTIEGLGGNDNLLVQFGADGQPYRQLILAGPENESVYEIQALPGQQLLLRGGFSNDTLSFLNLRIPRNEQGDTYTNFFATVQFPAVGTMEPAAPVATIRVWPNPALSGRPVQVVVDKFPGKGRIALFDCFGRLAGQFETDPVSGIATIPGNYLRRGVYFLRYQSEETNLSKVLVVTQ